MSEFCDGSLWEDGCSGPGWNSHFSHRLTKTKASSPLKKSHKSSPGRALMFLLSVPFLGHPPPESFVRRAGPWLSIPLLPSSFEFWPAMERSWIPKSLLPFVIPHPRLAPRPCTLLPRQFQLPSTPGNTPSALCKHHNSRTYTQIHTHTPKHTRAHASATCCMHKPSQVHC